MATASTTQDRASELNVLVRKQRSLWGDALYRLMRNKAAVGGLIVIAAAFLVAIFAPVLAPYNPILIPPSSELASQMEPQWTGSKYTDPRYLLGTDFLGRDILSRLIYASRISMIVGFVPTAIVFGLGVTVGMMAGFFGGMLDQLLMRFTDIIYAFPDFLFLLIIVASFRNSPFGKVLDGLMLISQLPMLVGGRFDMRLKIPGQDAQRFVDFSATCQWSHEDVTPGSFDSGFALVAPPAEYVEMVDALHRYFSFHPLSASA